MFGCFVLSILEFSLSKSYFRFLSYQYFHSGNPVSIFELSNFSFSKCVFVIFYVFNFAFLLRIEQTIQDCKDTLSTLVLMKSIVRPLKQAEISRQVVVEGGRVLASGLGGGGVISPQMGMLAESACK